ncbi:MAG: hypothetical protein MO852_05810 [Candidatus Devosia euplotis]|nr:hypothetical protein [Candidatus Devosia euplotis]
MLVSPSGKRSIEMAKLCQPMGCKHITIADEIQPDGSHLRTGCLPQRAETTPVLDKIAASWSASEDSMVIDFTPRQRSRRQDDHRAGELRVDQIGNEPAPVHHAYRNQVAVVIGVGGLIIAFIPAAGKPIQSPHGCSFLVWPG